MDAQNFKAEYVWFLIGIGSDYIKGEASYLTLFYPIYPMLSHNVTAYQVVKMTDLPIPSVIQLGQTNSKYSCQEWYEWWWPTLCHWTAQDLTSSLSVNP